MSFVKRYILSCRKTGCLLCILATAASVSTSTASPRSWVTPQSGWLYVIDTNNSANIASIHVLDPATGFISGSISAGYLPSAALSADGSRLYVASGGSELGSLNIIDTASGSSLASIPVPNLAVYIGLPAFQSLAVSPDSSKVYVERLTTLRPGVDTYSVATIDTVDRKRLSGEINLPECGPARILTGTTSPWDLQIYCGNGHYLKLVNVDPTGAESASVTVPIPDMDTQPGFAPASKRIGFTFLVSGSPSATLIRADGSMLDMSSLNAPRWRPSANAFPYWIPPLSWQATEDGSRLFVGLETSQQVGTGAVTVLGVIQNGSLTKTITTSVPIWSLCLSRDSRLLYAVSPETQSISVISTDTNKELHVIRSIGRSPAIALVAP
jgi:hypothetical protein